jgi:hypothetical protein
MILSAPIFVAMRTQLLGRLCVFFNMAFAGNLQIAPQATGGFVHAAASRRSNFGNVDSPPPWASALRAQLSVDLPRDRPLASFIIPQLLAEGVGLISASGLHPFGAAFGSLCRFATL